MAKRTLRNLSREIPTDKDFARIDDEAEDVSDRHFALSFAIELENTLRYAITAVLPRKDRTIIDKMVEQDGVLGTFSRKIDLGYALGLYDAQRHKELHIIRNIRNAFAHTMIPIAFDTPELVRERTKLTSGQENNPPQVTNRDRFKYTCQYILRILLRIMIDHGKGVPLIG